MLNRFDHTADAVQVDGAAEALCARAAVDDDGGDAGLLELAREVGRAPAGVVPAQTHLHGHGDTDSLNDRAHQVNRTGNIAHEGRAATAARDLVDRAAHVDIDGADTVTLQPARG